MTRLILCWLALACAACAGLPSPEADRAADRPAEPPPGAPVEIPSVFAGATEASANLRLSNAAALSEQAAQIIPGWHEADPELAESRDAIGRRNWPLGSFHADEAQSLADAALSDHYVQRAQEELDRAQRYTGLDDLQAQALEQGEETLSAGNGRLAYGRLRMLNEALARDRDRYTVIAGDSLWIISGRPEIYANPRLWPILWHANLAAVPDPSRLRKGQALEVPKHPTIDEVVRAVETAKRGARKLPEIGPVREAAPP